MPLEENYKHYSAAVNLSDWHCIQVKKKKTNQPTNQPHSFFVRPTWRTSRQRHGWIHLNVKFLHLKSSCCPSSSGDQFSTSLRIHVLLTLNSGSLNRHWRAPRPLQLTDPSPAHNLNCSILHKRPMWQPVLIMLPPRHPFHLTVISKLLRYWNRLSLLIKKVWTHLHDQSVKKAQVLSYRAYYVRLRPTTNMFTSN